MTSHDGRVLIHGEFDGYLGALTEFAGEHPHHGPTPETRDVLGDAAHQLGEKFGLLNPATNRSIARLRDDAPLLRVSHQPNVLAPLNVVGLALLQVAAKRAIADTTWFAGRSEPVVVFVFVDHDAAGDRRFRTPLVPAWNRAGLVSLSGAVPKRRHKQPALAVLPLPLDMLGSWFSTLEHSASHWANVLRESRPGVPPAAEVRQRLRKMAGQLEEIAHAGDNLAEVAGAMIAWVLTSVWGLDVICAGEAQVLTRLDPALKQLVRAADPDDLDRWLWRICPQCLEHRPTELALTPDDVHVRWSCSDCATGETSEALDFGLEIESEGRRIPAFLPRVAMEDEIDLSVYRGLGGVSYAGGVTHVADHRERIDPSQPQSPEYAWEPSGLLTRKPAGNDDRLTHIDRGRCPFPMYLSWETNVGDPPILDEIDYRPLYT